MDREFQAGCQVRHKSSQEMAFVVATAYLPLPLTKEKIMQLIVSSGIKDLEVLPASCFDLVEEE